MAKCRLALRCGVLLCFCMIQLAPTQGRSFPAGRATSAFMPSPPEGDSWTSATISTWGWSAPVPSSAVWLYPVLAPSANSLPRAMRRLTELAAAGPAPLQHNMCIPPPLCRWDYDKNGGAHPVCTAQQHMPRILGVFCPHSMSASVSAAIMVLMVGFLGVFFMLFVRDWAKKVLPCRNPWTRMCCFAFALGLIIGLSCPSGISLRSTSASQIPPPPGQHNMCKPPPDCKWGYDKNGRAQAICAAPLQRPRILGLMCPHQVPLYIATYVMAAALNIGCAYLSVALMMLVQWLADDVLPSLIRMRVRVPWTRMCCFAYVLGLLIGLAWSTTVSIKLDV